MNRVRGCWIEGIEREEDSDCGERDDPCVF